MKLVEIKHYVPKSFGDRPSFVLLMSDNKEYISNGCVFVENTQENVDGLIVGYDCQHWLDELFQSDGCDMSSVVDASYMFCNCKSLKTFSGDMKSVVNASFMFYNCKSLETFSGDMPSVVNASCMFYGCTSLDKNQPNNIQGINMQNNYENLNEVCGDKAFYDANLNYEDGTSVYAKHRIPYTTVGKRQYNDDAMQEKYGMRLDHIS